MEIRFERESLFQEVWSTPLTTLAKKYGMSDNGVRKVCKALNIPLPTAGHWAKVAAGKVIPTPPLPPTDGRTEFHSSPTPRSMSSPVLVEDEQWLTEQIEFEGILANRISVETEPQRWHRLVSPTRNYLKDLVKELEKSRREAEKPVNPSRRPQIYSMNNAWKWTSFVGRGQLFELYKKHLPMRVTPKTYERALAILNTFLFAAETRGIKPTHNEKDGRLSLSLRDCSIQMRFSEKISKVIKDKKKENATVLDRIRGVEEVMEPTGVLRVYLSASGSEIQFEESPEAPLETQLNEIFKRVYRAIAKQRVADHKWAKWHREYEEEQERRRRAEAIKREEDQQRAQEAERRKNLLVEAQSWRDAILIREYIAHIEQMLNSSGPGIKPELTGWIIWAEQVAEEMDPTTKLAS